MILNCKGKILNLQKPQVMGILNVTPDSFYDGGKSLQIENAVAHAEKMIEDGAAIIDVGGMSSRPGAQIIKEKEELSRVIPVIFELNKRFPDLIISIDTVRSKVADRACRAGASIINDISAGSLDSDIFHVAAEHNAPYILMHMQGTPENMQMDPSYEEVTREVLEFIIEKVRMIKGLGVKDIIIDPGFGFGKTSEHNYTLLKNLSVFRILDLPIMVGLSRKSMIFKLLNTDPSGALTGTIAAHVIALMQGAKMLRAHDVKEACETIRIYNEVYSKNVTV